MKSEEKKLTKGPNSKIKKFIGDEIENMFFFYKLFQTRQILIKRPGTNLKIKLIKGLY
jgi:hypothetical protein